MTSQSFTRRCRRPVDRFARIIHLAALAGALFDALPAPAQNGIAAANLRVVQVDTNNTVESVPMATP